MAYDADFFVIGAGSGGVRAARIAAMNGVSHPRRRGRPHRRHLRHSWLRAEETLRPREPLRRRFRGCGRLRLDSRHEHFRLAETCRCERERSNSTFGSLPAHLPASGAKLIEERARIVWPARGRACGRSEALGKAHSYRCRVTSLSFPRALRTSNTLSRPTNFSTCQMFPRRLLVVGGGYIAVEFAALFQRLGQT